MQVLGEAVHAFLAADDTTQPRNQRLDVAGMILKNWRAPWLKAEDLLSASDRLRGYVDKTYGKETIRHREWPVHLRMGDQKAVEKATARPVMATMIHMPVLGVIMKVKIGDVVKLR